METTNTQTRLIAPGALDRSAYYRLDARRNNGDWKQIGGASDQGQQTFKTAILRGLEGLATRREAKGYETRIVEILEWTRPGTKSA